MGMFGLRPDKSIPDDSGSMFGSKMGTYCTSSVSDSRFNYSWRKAGLVCWGTPDWIKKWVEKKTTELGLDECPLDLKCSFMKD